MSVALQWGCLLSRNTYYKQSPWVKFIARIRCPDFHCYFVIRSQQDAVCSTKSYMLDAFSTALFWLRSYCIVSLWIPLPYTCSESLKHSRRWANNKISDLLWFKGLHKCLWKYLHCCSKLRFNQDLCEYLPKKALFPVWGVSFSKYRKGFSEYEFCLKRSGYEPSTLWWVILKTSGCFCFPFFPIRNAYTNRIA